MGPKSYYQVDAAPWSTMLAGPERPQHGRQERLDDQSRTFNSITLASVPTATKGRLTEIRLRALPLFGIKQHGNIRPTLSIIRNVN